MNPKKPEVFYSIISNGLEQRMKCDARSVVFVGVGYCNSLLTWDFSVLLLTPTTFSNGRGFCSWNSQIYWPGHLYNSGCISVQHFLEGIFHSLFKIDVLILATLTYYQKLSQIISIRKFFSPLSCEPFRIRSVFLKLIELYKIQSYLLNPWNFPWKEKLSMLGNNYRLKNINERF